MAPLICTALVAITESLYSVAILVSVIALISFTCSYLMTESCAPGSAATERLHCAEGGDRLGPVG
jgi:hypothetical protein